MEYYSGIKKMKSAMCNNMDGPRGCYAKWNKSVRERQTPYDFIHRWNLRNKTNEQRKKRQTKKNRHLTIENKWLPEGGRWCCMGEIGEGD